LDKEHYSGEVAADIDWVLEAWVLAEFEKTIPGL
jgi:hypothetical protein